MVEVTAELKMQKIGSMEMEHPLWRPLTGEAERRRSYIFRFVTDQAVLFFILPMPPHYQMPEDPPDMFLHFLIATETLDIAADD